MTGQVNSMIVATKLISLEEYLEYDDGTDNIYELVNGELVLMPPESHQNQRIEISLLAYFLKLGIAPKLLRNQIAIAVNSGRVTVRIPDLTILTEDLELQLAETKQSVILQSMPSPKLVVEVVSPQQEKRDYRYKRSEYAVRQIPEYWIIDSIANKVTILKLVEGFYDEKVFINEESIESPQFGKLDITANQILIGI
jgi:Uma2 family endonuclease